MSLNRGFRESKNLLEHFFMSGFSESIVQLTVGKVVQRFRARQYLEPFAPHWHRSRHSEHDENSLGISRRSAKSAARSSAGAHYHTGSRATLASPDPPNDTMSGALQLSDMPPELLGKIFGFLTPPDITGLKLVGSVAGTTIYESF